MGEEGNNYRNILIDLYQKSQASYDTTIVSLSGGAIGLSIIFFKDIIGDSVPVCIFFQKTAWILWSGSITSVLGSYFFSRIALRKTMEQYDQKNFSEGVGGWATNVTEFLNVIAGLLFIFGIISFLIFASSNL